MGFCLGFASLILGSSAAVRASLVVLRSALVDGFSAAGIVSVGFVRHTAKEMIGSRPKLRENELRPLAYRAMRENL